MKFDDGHSRPNTTNPSTTGPCQLSDTAARLKGVLEKSDKQLQLETSLQRIPKTTCHLHRSCSSRLPRWDSLHEAMAPWIGASASERPWDSAFNAKTYPNLDIQHHPIYPISRSDSVSDFIRPGTPETMTSSSSALSGTIQG